VASTPVRAVGYPITTPGASSTVVTGPTAGTTTSNTVTAGGVDDTLADVAYYYNQTDLRPANSVNSVGEDVGTGILNTGTGALTYSFQNMTTFTLGLGIDGYMQFIDNYANEDGDYKDVKTGATSTSSRCTWQASGGICNWPTPGDSSQANIDDLWHAAINGKGSYYSAKTAKELQSSLTNALGKISGVLGTAAAATTSNPNITTGDNFLFSSDFTTGEWTSTLNRLQIDPTSGNIKTTVVNGNTVPLVDWNAQTLLDARVSATSDTRTIYTYGTYDTTSNSCAGTNLSATKLKPFCWTNVGTGLGTGTGTSLTSAEQLYFTHTAIDLLPQLCGGTTSGSYELTDTSGIVTTRSCLTEDQQNRTGGKNLVNFLRGQTGFEEESGNTDKLYRDRTHVLGDIVSSEAVYVKTPLYNYSDDGFTSFKALQSAYPGMVYVAANDGMLHAIYGNRAVEGSGNPPAVSGVAIGGELWAYIPSQVLPKMYNLASMNYPNAHQFLLDGTPVIGYISSGGGTPEWKTILVGGLAAGGAGYYALDITDPLNPQGLWEFKRKTAADCVSPTAPVGQTSDCDLGYSYGNPVITKVNGTWVVLVTSGYNNISPGDGQGYLYVLNAQTGAIINKIGTGVGSTGTITGVCDTAPCPSGLGKISAWVDNGNVDNTALRVYGGDLFGNLWRFDVNGDIGATGTDAQLLAVLKGPTGTLQPITQQPGLGETEDGIALVLVGTGKLLGDSDLNDPTQTDANLQSFYAIKDSLTATGWGNVRSAGLIQQTVAVDTSSDSRKITSPADVDLSSVPGWFIDFPASGERSYTDSALVLGTVVFTTNLPSETPCGAKGKSYIYFLDYRSGAPIRGETVGYPLGDALATRPVIVQLQGGAVRSITRLSDTTTDVRDVPIGNAGSPQRRISWRLLLEN
jgi:type IV pilus assembly protein PilY1